MVFKVKLARRIVHDGSTLTYAQNTGSTKVCMICMGIAELIYRTISFFTRILFLSVGIALLEYPSEPRSLRLAEHTHTSTRMAPKGALKFHAVHLISSVQFRSPFGTEKTTS